VDLDDCLFTTWGICTLFSQLIATEDLTSIVL